MAKEIFGEIVKNRRVDLMQKANDLEERFILQQPIKERVVYLIEIPRIHHISYLLEDATILHYAALFDLTEEVELICQFAPELVNMTAAIVKDKEHLSEAEDFGYGLTSEGEYLGSFWACREFQDIYRVTGKTAAHLAAYCGNYNSMVKLHLAKAEFNSADNCENNTLEEVKNLAWQNKNEISI